MSRKSISIPIDGQKLRELLLTKGNKVEGVATSLGCTRQTLHLWFTSNRIPPRQLASMVRSFSLTSADIKQVHRKNELTVLYRTLRDVVVPEQTQARVRLLASEVLSLYRSETPFKTGKTLNTFRGRSVPEMAEYIRKTLELPQHAVTLDQLLASLDSLNIPVIFVPFDEALHEANICAFTASILEERTIFVDRDCPLEDVPWRIFHELVHILAGHQSAVSKEDERYCDAVASEILTPARFFEANRSVLKSALNTDDLWRVPEVVRDVASHLGASFQGVILALVENRVVSRGSSTFKMLYRVHHSTKGNRKQVQSIFTPEEGKELDFWIAAFEDVSRKRFLKLHHLVRDGFLLGKVSVERAAELFDVDVMTMQNLKTRWMAQDVAASAG